MANIKSAKKRILVAKKATARNTMVKTSMKTAIKKFETALASGNTEEAGTAFKFAVKKIDMAASKGVLHKNNAARKKSKLALKLNTIGA